MTTYEAMRQKRAEIEEIARRHGALKVRVFGFVARGKETPEVHVGESSSNRWNQGTRRFGMEP